MKNPTQPIVALILFNPCDCTYLLQHHKSGKWGFMTGRIEEKDTVNIGDPKQNPIDLLAAARNALIREAKEELDLNLINKQADYIGSVYPKSQYDGHKSERFEAFVFYAEYSGWESTATIINMEPETCLELKWMSLEDVKELVKQDIVRVTTKEIINEEIIEDYLFNQIDDVMIEHGDGYMS